MKNYSEFFQSAFWESNCKFEQKNLLHFHLQWKYTSLTKIIAENQTLRGVFFSSNHANFEPTLNWHHQQKHNLTCWQLIFIKLCAFLPCQWKKLLNYNALIFEIRFAPINIAQFLWKHNAHFVGSISLKNLIFFKSCKRPN